MHKFKHLNNAGLMHNALKIGFQTKTIFNLNKENPASTIQQNIDRATPKNPGHPDEIKHAFDRKPPTFKEEPIVPSSVTQNGYIKSPSEESEKDYGRPIMFSELSPISKKAARIAFETYYPVFFIHVQK